MRRVALLLGAVVGVLFLLNRQWLYENTLVNSPSFDALVYQNLSYDDYALLRESGPSALWQKYTSGRWHAPPLHTLSGTFAYLLLGRDPANFYIAPALWLYLMALGTYGFVYLWTRRMSWAAIALLLLFGVQSVVAFGLRVSQIDFSVGAAFTWATYVLVASDGLRSRRGALVYALSTGLSVLLKSSIVPYFLAHGLIWLLYLTVDRKAWRERALNTLLVSTIVFAMSGWFFITNIRQIIAYYTLFGGELSNVARSYTGACQEAAELLFYACSLAVFHLQGRHASVYTVTAVAMAGLFLVSVARWGALRRNPRLRFGLLIAFAWLVVPYLVLSVYRSKTFSVDFPFLAAYLVIPVLMAAAVPWGRWLVVGLLAFLPFGLVQVRDQVQLLVVQQAPQNWREREVLRDLFADADRRGLRQVTVSNGFIHTYLTSENLRFFVVNGTFDDWRGRYKILGLPYFFDAQSYLAFLLDADYILAKTGGLQIAHPNNAVAPELNRLLAATPALSEVKRYGLPDGSELLLYHNASRVAVSYPPPFSDGWVAPRFPLSITGPAAGQVINLRGQLPIPADLGYPVAVFLTNEQGTVVSDVQYVADSAVFALSLRIAPTVAPATADGPTTLYLTTDKPFRPSERGASADTRELMLRLESLAIADPPR